MYFTITTPSHGLVIVRTVDHGTSKGSISYACLPEDAVNINIKHNRYDPDKWADDLEAAMRNGSRRKVDILKPGTETMIYKYPLENEYQLGMGRLIKKQRDGEKNLELWRVAFLSGATSGVYSVARQY